MNSLLYLAIAVGISVVGALVLYGRNRKPTSLDAGIEGFRRELRALDPGRRPERRTPEHGEGRDGRQSGLGA